jgi:uncharacterized membrane protein
LGLIGRTSALLLLILETTNELVRFHAWQSALLTTPLVLLHFLLKLIFPAWLKLIYNIFALGLVAFMAFVQPLQYFALQRIADPPRTPDFTACARTPTPIAGWSATTCLS